MKIFLGGAVSVATQEQLEKYNIYKEVLTTFGELTVPDDIWAYRQKCTHENPEKTKMQIDKMMVDYDLNLARNTDLMICDISQQSTGLGLELGVVHENSKKIIFFYEKGAYISNMLTGAFFDADFVEYESTKELRQKLKFVMENN